MGKSDVFAELYSSNVSEQLHDARNSVNRLVNELENFWDKPTAIPDWQPATQPEQTRDEVQIMFVETLVGKIAFLEVGEDSFEESGEYIIVEQSEDFYYGVSTASCLRGNSIVQIGASAKVLSVCEDDPFIEEFAERLDGMMTDEYPDIACDAAESVAAKLRRMVNVNLQKRARRELAAVEMQDMMRMFSKRGALSGRWSPESN